MLKVSRTLKRVPVSDALIEQAQEFGKALQARHNGSDSPRIMWNTPGMSNHWTFYDGNQFTYMQGNCNEWITGNYHNGRVIDTATDLEVSVNA